MDEIVLEDVKLTQANVPGEADYEVQIPQGDDRKLEFGQTQTNKLRQSSRTVYVFNRGYVGFRINNKAEQVALAAFLNSEPDIRLKVSWVNIGLTLLCFTGGAYSLYSSVLPMQYSLGLLGAGLFFLILSIYRSSHRAVYSTGEGEVPIFELYVNNPNKKTFQKLTEKIGRRIDEAKSKLPTDKNRLALEMAEHRRLQKAGIISEQQYEAAKKNIFQHFSR